jgi:alpha 1,3-glucosidase
VAAPLEKIPAYQRGGTIIPYRERPRRSANAMQLDPFTLVAALTTKVRQQKKNNPQGGKGTLD